MTARESIRPVFAKSLLTVAAAVATAGLRTTRDAHWYALRRLQRAA
jgi:hypothetical protein